MKEILGQAKTVRQLLSGTKYAIDYFQREYKWQTKQVLEFITDLATRFEEDYETDHKVSDVRNYGRYFLGSIIISNKDTRSYIIDGQQRLTTLTLLLIYIRNLQQNRDEKIPVDELIYSQTYDEKSFNLDVPDRFPVMEALFNQQDMNGTELSESLQNIMGRYRDIEENFPQNIAEKALANFGWWLLENVYLVQITAHSDDDAYIIFETMNDRGLSLTPTDMLKGYLLTNITDEPQRKAAGQTWKERIGALLELGKDEDADALKAWLRSQYADTIRERKKGAPPGDFDRLGTEFHRWINEHITEIELTTNDAFASFIQCDMDFYTRQYLRLRSAANTLTDGLETVFYNAQHKFTLQYPLMLAPLTPQDHETLILRKIRIVGVYLDILLTRRLWNYHAIDYSTVQYSMFNLMRAIRHKTPQELVAYFTTRLEEDTEKFQENPRFYMRGKYGSIFRQILARITDHVERQSGMPPRFREYIVTQGNGGFEIEHIWANHFDRHQDEFPHQFDFQEARNRIGGLLLLPKSFNASYGDLSYEKKLEHYYSQNLLARSLHPKCYQHNPGFLAYIHRSGLPFKSHPQFNLADLDERQELYLRIADEIWSPDRLQQEAQK